MKNCPYFLAIVTMLLLSCPVFAQVTNNIQLPTSINNDGTAPASSAIFDVKSTDKGVLIPRMSSVQRNNIPNPAMGLLVYDNNTSSYQFFNGSSWVELSENVGVFESDAGRVYNTANVATDDYVFGSTNLPTSGISSGTMMFFEKGQSAFRGGEIFNSLAWEPSNVGQNSFAYGYNCMASSTASISLGSNNTSSGDAAISIGEECQAIGQTSLATGYGSNAQGNYSFAQGYLSSAGNDYSIAMGRVANASGLSSIAIGEYAQSSGQNSFAMGNIAQSMATNSIAMGANAIAGSQNSVAIGSDNEAYGNQSVAFGFDASTNGNYAVALGSNCEASGNNSVAIGRYAEALGTYSIAIGNNNHSLGYSGLVVGMYNNPIVVSPQTSIDSNTPLFIVGNGDSAASRSNAMVVRKDGYVGIDNDNPGADLHVGTTTGSSIRLGSGESISDQGTWELGFNGTVRPLNDNLDDLGTSTFRWDDVYATNGTINTSDRRLKQNITNINYGLDAVMKLNPVQYQWKNQRDEVYKLGLIAQDVLEIVPEVVKTHDWVAVDETMINGERNIEKVALERMGIYYSDLVPVLIQATKEQQEIIEKQAQQNADLEKRLEKLESLLLQKE